MKIVKKEDIRVSEFKHGFGLLRIEIIELAEKAEIGDAVKLDSMDWTFASMPNSGILNKYFEKINSPKRFAMRSLTAHKGFIFIRTK